MDDDQGEFDARCDWGADGLHRAARGAEIIVIVDVLSFATAVSIAVERGATVFPFARRGDEAAAYARRRDALLAGDRDQGAGYSLFPHSLLTIPAGTRLVQPSPNGATLTLAAAAYCPTVCVGCLRNAAAVASVCRAVGGTVAVVAAGEVWRGETAREDALRFAVEDLVGAGAILTALAPRRPSPEAAAAMALFHPAQSALPRFLLECASGQELIARGYGADVGLAAERDVGQAVPFLRDGALVPWTADTAAEGNG